jgi:hypothetical protein
MRIMRRVHPDSVKNGIGSTPVRDPVSFICRSCTSCSFKPRFLLRLRIPSPHYIALLLSPTR